MNQAHSGIALVAVLPTGTGVPDKLHAAVSVEGLAMGGMLQHMSSLRERKTVLHSTKNLHMVG
jgi:hypothetical protein